VMNSRRLIDEPSGWGPHSSILSGESSVVQHSKSRPLMTGSGSFFTLDPRSMRLVGVRCSSNNSHKRGEAARTLCAANTRHCHFRDFRKGISLLVPVPVGSHAAERLE
jgi:hypothetical protein